MFTIHRATPADAPAMHALQQLAFSEEGRRCGTREIPPLLEDVGAIRAHVETQLALVARRDGDGGLVGCVRGLPGEPACTVRALVVHPAWQGRGIGSRLLLALEAALPRPTRIELDTNTVMEGNVPFYERHGYHVSQTATPWPGVVLAHMVKHLAPV